VRRARFVRRGGAYPQAVMVVQDQPEFECKPSTPPGRNRSARFDQIAPDEMAWAPGSRLATIGRRVRSDSDVDEGGVEHGGSYV